MILYRTKNAYVMLPYPNHTVLASTATTLLEFLRASLADRAKTACHERDGSLPRSLDTPVDYSSATVVLVASSYYVAS